MNFVCVTHNCMYYRGGECTRKFAIIIQGGSCCDFKGKLQEYKYSLVAGVPALLSRVYVTVNGSIYYEARFLGYGEYGGNSNKTYCVELIRQDRPNHVDFFTDIYSRNLEGDHE